MECGWRPIPVPQTVCCHSCFERKIISHFWEAECLLNKWEQILYLYHGEYFKNSFFIPHNAHYYFCFERKMNSHLGRLNAFRTNSNSDTMFYSTEIYGSWFCFSRWAFIDLRVIFALKFYRYLLLSQTSWSCTSFSSHFLS